MIELIGLRVSHGQTATAVKPSRSELPKERFEVGGTCATPRQAWLQHLWWAGRGDYNRASLCFDSAAVARSSASAAELAERLFDHLNANALYIDTADPRTANPNYLDPLSGEAIYADASAPAFAIRKYADGRWRMGPEAIQAIPEFGITKRFARKLPSWFHFKLFGIPAWSFLAIIVLFLVAFVVRRFTMFFINRYLRRWAKRTKLLYASEIADRIDRPIAGFSMAVIFYLGFPLLSFPLRAAEIALVATKALAAFSLVWIGYRLIDVIGSWMTTRAEKTETKLDDQLVPLVTKTLKVFVSVLGGIFVLQNLNVNVGSLLAGVGLGGLAFALAAKDTVANLFGSIMIFIDKPFQIGDWVVVGDTEGTVEEVGFRTTRVRTFYNSRVTLPNSIIANSKVDNYGAREYRRYVTNLGLTYDTPPEKVQAFCEAVRAVISRMPGMRRDYYLVEFKEFSDSALVVMLYCFMIADSWNDELQTRTHLNLEILRVAAKLGVSFAFPTQTLHLESVATPTPPPTPTSDSDLDNLASIVASFAIGGSDASAGFEISRGYDCREDWDTPTSTDSSPGGGE